MTEYTATMPSYQDLQDRRLESRYTANPYDQIAFSAKGPANALAVFLDETFEAAHCALSGCPYVQGAAVKSIQEAIETEGHYDTSPVTCLVFKRS